MGLNTAYLATVHMYTMQLQLITFSVALNCLAALTSPNEAPALSSTSNQHKLLQYVYTSKPATYFIILLVFRKQCFFRFMVASVSHLFPGFEL